jgi:hypothetical protein
MYTVLHSPNDPYLLARMATDLQMEGFRRSGEDYEEIHPFNKEFKWIAVYGKGHSEKGDVSFGIHSHSCGKNATHFTLTSKNYLETLQFLIENKG